MEAASKNRISYYLQSLLRNYESLNAILAKYWCGLQLSDCGSSVNINLYSHAEVSSGFYNQALKAFKDNDALTGHKLFDNS
jgi:hypothetical protein